MEKDLLLKLIVDGMRRIVTHYGLWFAETVHQMGFVNAMEAEKEAGDSSFIIQIKRLSKIFGFKIDENGIPLFLKEKNKDELEEILKNISLNWLANDGVWFQSIEKRYGMNDAKRCNDSCWTKYSPYEALRIKEVLNLGEHPGIEGLKKALQYRMYAFINKQSIEVIDDNTIIFRMNDCRVQSARKRKGLPDYPCKTAGLVEYTYFAHTIDSRIKTECICCPPDEHPEDCYCAWKFYIKEGKK
jgi:hypothetical protein